MSSEKPYEERETPLEKAVRERTASQTALGRDAADEHEADMLVTDIDDYVAETDPASLDEAGIALNAWQIPSDPLETRTDIADLNEDTALVSVLTAQTESEANIVRGLLESEGIPVAFDNRPSPILGSVLSAGDAAWGHILVPEPDAEQARAIIAANLAPESMAANPSTQQ